ncbi:hypothetical protein ES705_31484 [subsurface metagenome]
MDSWGINTIGNWSDATLGNSHRKPYVAKFRDCIQTPIWELKRMVIKNTRLSLFIQKYCNLEIDNNIIGLKGQVGHIQVEG